MTIMHQKAQRLACRADSSDPGKIDAPGRIEFSHAFAREITILLFLSVLVALLYWGAKEGPFVFDDLRNIQDNPKIRLSSLNLEDLKR